MSPSRASGTSMIGKPERFGVCTPSRSRCSRTVVVLRQSEARTASPLRSLTSRPASTVASEAVGDGPEYRYGGAAVFNRRFSSGGQVRKAASDEYALDNPATRMTWSNVSPAYLTMLLPLLP